MTRTLAAGIALVEAAGHDAGLLQVRQLVFADEAAATAASESLRGGSTEWVRLNSPAAGNYRVCVVGYAPADDPQIAVAVAVEGGGYGGSTAAPIARAIFDAWLEPLRDLGVKRNVIAAIGSTGRIPYGRQSSRSKTTGPAAIAPARARPKARCSTATSGTAGTTRATAATPPSSTTSPPAPSPRSPGRG